MSTLSFEIMSGAVEVGLCDFTVRLGESSWSCQASYLHSLPISDLIHVAIDLYEHLFEDPLPLENAVWDALAADEPGGIVIRAMPADDQAKLVKLTIFYYPTEPMWPKPDELPEIPPVAEGLVDYWEFATAVYNDAARTLLRHGTIGLRSAWEPGHWGIDGHWSVFPFEHFMYLATLVKYRRSKESLTFEEELTLLREIREKHQ
jgi:hypothetical protein